MAGSPIKILMTADTLGGVWTYSMELCRVLGTYGVEIHLAGLGAFPSKSQQKELGCLDHVKFYGSDFKLEWMQNCGEDLKKIRLWIQDLQKMIKPDIIHFNNYIPLKFDRTPVITVFHSCVDTWWQAVKGVSAPAGEWQEYKNLVKQSLEYSDLVVSPTAALLRNAMETYSFSTSTRVIRNGRRIKFAKVEKENFILGMGRIWDEAKNLKILSEIAPELAWPVYIAGNNKDPNTGKEINIPNVNFLGNLSSNEIKNYLEKAAIFISPAKYEPFGLSILEAAKAKTALALSNIDTLQELWGGAANFFDPSEKLEVKRELIQLIENENFRKTMAGKACYRASSFSLSKMGEAYFDVYEALLKNSRRPTKNLSYSI